MGRKAKSRKSEFSIERRRIGENFPPFVIAEVGINHEGDYKKALRLIDAAVWAKADCVKFQCHITDKEMIPTDMKPGKISSERLWDIIRRCELDEDTEERLKKYCEKKKIMYLSTPFSREAADRLDKLGVSGFKIGSGECNNFPLVEHIAQKRKPVILSTGMNTVASIMQSVKILRYFKVPFLLMHCVSRYPTPYQDLRLGAIQELQDIFRVPVGLSDHSHGIYTCLGAVALGACALEKHFTITRSWPGPDIPLSIEPHELQQLVIGSRAVWQALGGHKGIQKEEKPVIDFAYASVVTIRKIQQGEPLTLDNIWVKRPGTGDFLAKDFSRILGRKARRHLEESVQLKKGDV